MTAHPPLLIEYAADGEFVFTCPVCGYQVMVTDDSRHTLTICCVGDASVRHATSMERDGAD